jgi:hypothetical protein
VISGARTDLEPSRIAAILRETPAGNVTRAFAFAFQEAGLSYTVSDARLASVSVAVSEHETEKPCEEAKEGEGWLRRLRGSHHHRDCGPSQKQGPHKGNKIVPLVMISAAASILLLLICVCARATVCRSVVKPQGPKVAMVGGAPCKSSPVKDAPSPIQGSVVDITDNNNNNAMSNIVIGHVVTAPSKEDGLDYV